MRLTLEIAGYEVEVAVPSEGDVDKARRHWVLEQYNFLYGVKEVSEIPSDAKNHMGQSAFHHCLKFITENIKVVKVAPK